jgi:hypothetical protein
VGLSKAIEANKKIRDRKIKSLNYKILPLLFVAILLPKILPKQISPLVLFGGIIAYVVLFVKYIVPLVRENRRDRDSKKLKLLKTQQKT